ncbi:Uncharacterized protein APZ42_025037 [Daphnia magna]|uniref:Core-binding (CB) domain-containing protein n=1 Tax=Daphnia magna TaxID=35525 RepID=A0A164TIQ5_9CRUS|nr:Uncharacterized protein APZ42_025037 [Daphnia magna]
MSRPPSEFFRGRFYDPRVTCFDQPVPEGERMREREMRIRSHLQHPSYQLRERSPIGFPRHLSQWASSGYGFFSPLEDQDPRAVFTTIVQNIATIIHTVQQSNKDFYFYSEDGLCYDAKGFCYRFEEDGFYYNVVTGCRHDSGGFACDEKGVRIRDSSDTSDEDPEANDPPPVNKTAPPPSDKSGSAHPKSKTGQPTSGKSLSSGKRTSPPIEETNAVSSVTQHQVEKEVNSDQSKRSRPWRPSSTSSPAQGGGEVEVAAPVVVNLTPTEAVAPIPVITIEGVSLPGGSGSQPLSVSKDISEEISSLMTKGISTDTSKSVSREFPLEFVDAEFSLKPPKLDGWISRRVPLKADKSIVRSINAAEESFTKAQLNIMDITPPLIDLYARLHSLPDSESLKRPVQAALQQWGRAFFHITKGRRRAVISLAEPGAEYLLRDPDAFESGKEARSFFFTDRDIQAMLTDASQDNTLAQAARAAAAARFPKRSSTRHVLVDQPGSIFPPPRYGAGQTTRGGKGRRGRSDRGRGQRGNAWLQGGRRPALVPNFYWSTHATSPGSCVRHQRSSHQHEANLPAARIRLSEFSRLETLRRSYDVQGFSQPAIELFLVGSRANTNAAYESAWVNWRNWCLEWSCDPLRSDLALASAFLAHLHASGKSYSTINLHRSMLSATLSAIDGIPIGQQPLIVKLLKGCYNQNPPRPRYDFTWDPNRVFQFMSSLGSNEFLPLPPLSGKLVTLLALATLLRVSELASIAFASVELAVNTVRFSLSKPRKSQRSGPLQSFTLSACPDLNTCPVEALRFYVNRTSINRPPMPAKQRSADSTIARQQQHSRHQLWPMPKL